MFSVATENPGSHEQERKAKFAGSAVQIHDGKFSNARSSAALLDELS